jgi:hypothetical protein
MNTQKQSFKPNDLQASLQGLGTSIQANGSSSSPRFFVPHNSTNPVGIHALGGKKFQFYSERISRQSRVKFYCSELTAALMVHAKCVGRWWDGFHIPLYI